MIVAAEAGSEGLRLLTPDYIYPYNLHSDVPEIRKARSLDELVCIYHEGRSLKPGDMKDIEVSEPYRSWLACFD